MSRVSAVTLDAAGTLIHVRHPVGETYASIAARRGIPVQAQDIAAAFRTVFPRMAPLAFGACQPQQLARQERDWWRTLVRNCLGRHGQHPAFNAFFDELYAYYHGAAAWAVYPEVIEVLDALEARGIAAAVVSNFDSRLHAVLRELGLHDRFRTVLCSSEAGAAKPDARIFAAACLALRSRPQQTLHAGDDRRADLQGARAAGLMAIWICRGQQRHIPDADCASDLHGVISCL
jgi:putative hydrolase of the HAD superfamily